MSERSHMQGSIIITWILALITVCLRFFARRLSKAGFWYDDWLIIVATLFTTALCFASSVWMADQYIDGFVQTPELFTKAIIVSEICWVVVIWMVKYSILAFYWRLFSANGRSVRIIIWALAACVTTWGIIVVLLRFLQCSPPRTLWDFSVEGTCHFRTIWLFVPSTIAHIITDIALLGFPVPLIRKLDMPRSQKNMLTAIFAMGSFVTVVSIVRLTYLVRYYRHDDSFLWIDYADIFIWTAVETNVSIICACLPCLRPILPFISEKLKMIHNLLHGLLRKLQRKLRRKRRSSHKRGSELLLDMLPDRRSASSPVSPISGAHGWSDDKDPIIDSTQKVDVEANTPQTPELDSNTPGAHVLEIQTVEPMFEMESPKPVVELEAWGRSMGRIEGQSKYVAEH